MTIEKFKQTLKQEIKRLQNSGISKKNEIIIEDFTFEEDFAPKAIIKNKKYAIFNSNDYLGLRLNRKIIDSEHKFAQRYGAGPGAVRFISGTMKVHKKLEKAVANFHNREDCIIFSSAFATNFGVLHSLIKGQSKDSLISKNTLVISDQLNHRSIIDGIRVAGLNKENKAIFKHKNEEDLKNILEKNKGKFKRVLVISDGIFSMLGDYQEIDKLNQIIKKYNEFFEEGIILVIDDAHGIGAFGKTGKGTEEICNSKADVLIGTFGKAFGVDGGYVVGDKILIDYLRESAATYIYSNPISPGTAGALLKTFEIVNSNDGKKLLKSLNQNIDYFKQKIKDSNYKLASNSKHPIQPILIGDPLKTRKIVDDLFQKGILVTNISYPIVPKGQDEIRIQLNALHTKKDIDDLFDKLE